jgi:hypothetical protein
MNILDFQSFIDMRQKSFGRFSGLTPAVSITPKLDQSNKDAKAGDLEKVFSQTTGNEAGQFQDGSIATISYTDPKTGTQRSKDVQIVKMK